MGTAFRVASDDIIELRLTILMNEFNLQSDVF